MDFTRLKRSSSLFAMVCLLLFMLVVVVVEGQQEYVDNHQLDCYNQSFDSVTKGFVCNGLQTSCQAYLTFRSTATYYSPATISYLLAADDQKSTALLIASTNNISSDVTSIPEDTLLIIPVTNCSCYASEYYQHNASYTLKFTNETYFTVANNTYQGLTTCQAMMDQNPSGDRNLTVGLGLEVPLRCACPTSNQTGSGVKYLLTYMVTWGDSPTSIAKLFGVTEKSLLDANKLTSESIIYPFTPLLVPLTTEPSIQRSTSAPPPASPPPPQIPVVPVTNNSSDSKKWVYVGVGVGAALLVLVLVVFGVFLFRKRKAQDQSLPAKSSSEPKVLQSDSISNDYMALPDNKSSSWSLSSHGIRYAIESLTLYKFEDLQLATSCFDEANRIKGSVYKGNFKGDAAAIKVMKGDVLSEINILKKINHSNIIRLSGFCLHDGNTYLVYEYAERGSLSDWLHSSETKQLTLSWKQRVQIAHDLADALNYLHNYTNPPLIHKNLKCSNILLDVNLRAKVTNFGLSRSLETDGNDGFQMTRHVVGTQGYMAPEYMENGVITPKLDVFAFGVIILELLSGKEASSSNKNAGKDVILLHSQISDVLEGENVRQKLRNFIDPSLKDEYPLDLAFSLAQLAKRCVTSDLNARPSINEVFMILSKICSSLMDWDPSDEIERSTSVSSGR